MQERDIQKSVVRKKRIVNSRGEVREHFLLNKTLISKWYLTLTGSEQDL